jgi:hypothetical protein
MTVAFTDFHLRAGAVRLKTVPAAKERRKDVIRHHLAVPPADPAAREWVDEDLHG